MQANDNDFNPTCNCQHLGTPIESRDGITLLVKCGCKGDEAREQFYPAYECTIHNRCLPTYKPLVMNDWLERVPESEIYHLCHGCKDKTLQTAET